MRCMRFEISTIMNTNVNRLETNKNRLRQSLLLIFLGLLLLICSVQHRSNLNGNNRLSFRHNSIRLSQSTYSMSALCRDQSNQDRNFAAYRETLAKSALWAKLSNHSLAVELNKIKFVTN